MDQQQATPATTPTEQASCPSCGAATETGSGSSGFVYALGRIEPRFPRISVEKELFQVMGRSDSASLTDRQALQKILSQRQYRYLARQLCWVFTVEGLETYLLLPRDPADFDLLIDALRPAPSRLDVDVVIGVRGPIASPQMCNGLMLPIVAFDQIYSFDRDALIGSIPKPKDTKEKEFAPVAGEIFDRIVQLSDNAGSTDEHRALNYLVVRYPAIYSHAADAFARNCSLTSVDTRQSHLASARNIVEVIFSFTNRTTDVVEKAFVRVDVTEEFPFLVTKMSPYYDR
jgi:hypothetical protein